MIEAAAYEFAETEDYIKTGEELLGPYVWGQYDLLVLPPTFPYGGMENPCLTFVTPTLLGKKFKCLKSIWGSFLITIKSFINSALLYRFDL